MSDLVQITGKIARVDFDKVRKLKPTHGAISNMLTMAQTQLGRAVSVQDLVTDAFVGNRYLVFALLIPGLLPNEKLTLDKVSEYIDKFYEKGGKPTDLQDALVTVLSDYLQIEQKPTEDEAAPIPNATASATRPDGDG